MKVAGCIGNTIKLGSGVYFDLANPSHELIKIEDIAASLSKTCRFGGHCKGFYSVAEHCVLAAEAAMDAGECGEACRAIFLHDAAEAYVGDVVKPLKVMLPEFCRIEKRIEREIEKAFGVDLFNHEGVIRKYDLAMLFCERRQLFGEDNLLWYGEGEVEPISRNIKFWIPEKAYSMFMMMYRHLFLD